MNKKYLVLLSEDSLIHRTNEETYEYERIPVISHNIVITAKDVPEVKEKIEALKKRDANLNYTGAFQNENLDTLIYDICEYSIAGIVEILEV